MSTIICRLCLKSDCEIFLSGKHFLPDKMSSSSKYFFLGKNVYTCKTVYQIKILYTFNCFGKQVFTLTSKLFLIPTILQSTPA